MPDLDRIGTAREGLYSEALTAIAMGVPRDEFYNQYVETVAELLSDEEIDAVLGDAKRDALKQGVEREDIDDSWFT